MSDEHETPAIKGQERHLLRELRKSQSAERERQAAEAEAATEAKIARLREARLAKEAAERQS